MGSSAALIFSTVAGIYLLAVLLRFLLQVAKADFYNPVSQAVIKITDPMVRVLRTVIPGYKGIDFSSLVLAFAIEAVAICTLIILYGESISNIGYTNIVTWAFAGVLLFIIQIYYYAILASIIMSFVMMFSGSTNPHPLLLLVWQLTEPIMGPVRKIIPSMGGLDFSPIFIFIAIQIIQNFILTTFGVGPYAAVIIGI
ncbi:MAG: YggT family protein [Gammaproteobacteria bacterium]|jgi:YggT family protein|tara:strand:+ start:234 stop:827 length:594 start_codon:yes stop_codon:yes gene_type:complete